MWRRCGEPETLAAIPTRAFDPARLAGQEHRLYAAARALCGDPHLAEDLVHDVLASALARPRPLLRGDETAYLMRALRNRWTDHLRARARRPPAVALDALAETPSPRPGPEQAVEHAELLATVRALPSPFRETLVSVDVVGLSYEETARALRIPRGTVMSRVHRAREKVAAQLRAPVGAAAAA